MGSAEAFHYKGVTVLVELEKIKYTFRPRIRQKEYEERRKQLDLAMF
ncbi:MAG: hypothetical protein HY515_05020 [Candidatus Aenigmarchaeota archaeon]|nr:hypothetical protein [Candidatus Aenigmarchaeota archaeon]